MSVHNFKIVIIPFLISILLLSCKTGTVNLFKPASPHEQYLRTLTSTGFDKTAAGKAWIDNAQSSLQKPSTIKLPFKERGYFAAERIPAVAYKFSATKGQKIFIGVSHKPIENFRIYVDLMVMENEKIKSLAFVDTVKTSIEYEINNTGEYLVRLQPELLTNGEYTLEINYGPSLDYPIKTISRNNIQSFWGDGRDANSRKHEGIDLFAPRFTPVIAAAAGTVTRVNENNLGGKVVWMRPTGKDFTLYYAHLDKQIAIEGQQVSIGDTLGLMGNTGNAKTTSPHLHFGIYTSNGAVDPLPFVNPIIKPLPEITASLSNLNSTMKTTRSTTLLTAPNEAATTLSSLPVNSIILVNAATRSWYYIETPDGKTGYIASNRVSSVSKPIKTLKISALNQEIYDKPDRMAAVKSIIPINTNTDVLGYSGDFSLIKDSNNTFGWVKSR